MRGIHPRFSGGAASSSLLVARACVAREHRSSVHNELCTDISLPSPPPPFSEQPSLEEAPLYSEEWFAFRKRKWLGIAATRRIKAQLNEVKDSAKLGEIMVVSIFFGLSVACCVFTSTCSCSCRRLATHACASEATAHVPRPALSCGLFEANAAGPAVRAPPQYENSRTTVGTKGGCCVESAERCPASGARIVGVYGPTL